MSPVTPDRFVHYHYMLDSDMTVMELVDSMKEIQNIADKTAGIHQTWKSATPPPYCSVQSKSKMSAYHCNLD